MTAFEAQAELLRAFLDGRASIVDRIDRLLATLLKLAPSVPDAEVLRRSVEDCFFAVAGNSFERSRLRGRLEAARGADGFRPRAMNGVHNDLVDPADLIARALHFWRVTRRSGALDRAKFAQTLFDATLLRQLELSSLRLWDDDRRLAGARLRELQGLLDGLNAGSPADQPRLLRDARWLLPLAQSPTNEQLGPYFDVAERVADALPIEDSVEVQRATVVLAGGHLRSQLRHYELQGSAPSDRDVVLKSRRSNALDFAILVQGLVSLLEAYARAKDAGDARRRLRLAEAIGQGVSADPELFVERIDLLGPYTMIETLFVAASGDGHIDYTPVGHRHLRCLRDYAMLMSRHVATLATDFAAVHPTEDGYSPFGAVFGFASSITELLAMRALLREPAAAISLEDAFEAGDASTGKRAWVRDWRRLPHVAPEVVKRFDYPQAFVATMHARVAASLERKAAMDVGEAQRCGRVELHARSQAPPLPARYRYSSATCDPAQLLRDRHEGEFLVSFESEGGGFAVGKDLLTGILGEGEDVAIGGLPPAAMATLHLMLLDRVREERG